MKRLAVLISAALVGLSPGIATGDTALIVGGAGPYAELDEQQIRSALGGYFATYDLVKVEFPGWAGLGYSIDVGADNMMTAIAETPGPKTLGGVSKGAPVIDEVLRRLMEDDDRPAPAELNAVIYGYPNRTVFARNGVPYRPLPETPYDVLIVKAQYDGLADWPDNTLNFLAVVNALMGATQFHVDAAFYDIDLVPREAPYYTESVNGLGGKTTSILIPTPILPLLRPLAPNGVATDFVRFLDGLLRPVIDSAYNRAPVGVRSAITSSAEDEKSSSAVELVKPLSAGQPARASSAVEVDSRGADFDTKTDAETEGAAALLREETTAAEKAEKETVPSRSADDAATSAPQRSLEREKPGPPTRRETRSQRQVGKTR
ncbi:PE-PPE domain-containing protein [Mycobacterium sp. pV006]|uniref:PE-PPE domain-containing protein n=1 Tax=Mycobacterium sp. pV006 TaxID=3238983 RepID=UPI00351AD434